MTAPEQMWFGTTSAAAYTGMPRNTVLKASRAVDPASYPPPLQCTGRRGAGRNARLVFHKDDLDDWMRSLARFG